MTTLERKTHIDLSYWPFKKLFFLVKKLIHVHIQNSDNVVDTIGEVFQIPQERVSAPLVLSRL